MAVRMATTTFVVLSVNHTQASGHHVLNPQRAPRSRDCRQLHTPASLGSLPPTIETNQ